MEKITQEYNSAASLCSLGLHLKSHSFNDNNCCYSGLVPRLRMTQYKVTAYWFTHHYKKFFFGLLVFFFFFFLWWVTPPKGTHY